MSLENLLKIGQLKEHPPDTAEIDTLRRQRNVADYTGQDVDTSTAEHCIKEATQLLADVIRWLKDERSA